MGSTIYLGNFKPSAIGTAMIRFEIIYDVRKTINFEVHSRIILIII